MKIDSSIQEHNLKLGGIYAGLDLSLTSSAMAILEPGQLRIFRFKCGDKDRGLARLLGILTGVMTHLDKAKPACVAQEGYSFGSKSQSHSLGELGGQMKMELARSGLKTIIVPPGSLKKFVTGKGNAEGKGALMLGVYKRWGFELPQDDKADSTALAIYAAFREGGLTGQLPQPNMEALKGCEDVISPFAPARRRFRSEASGLQPVAL